MSVEVVIPVGANDDATRVAARGWVRRWYVERGYATTIARCPLAEWSKGAAANPAISASGADVVVLADADSYVADDALARAIDAASVSGWAMPHSHVRRLSRASTAALIAGDPPRRMQLERGAYPALPGGGIVVATREAWAAVGGVDPRYLGWGGEDHALGLALRAIVGPMPRRGVVPLWHLWHTPAPRHRKPAPESYVLDRRYRAARGDTIAMRELVGEWSGVRA